MLAHGFFETAIRLIVLTGTAVRRCRDLVDGQVGAGIFLFRIETDTDDQLQQAVDQETACQRHCYAEARADELRRQADATHAAQCLGAEDACSDTAPGATQTV